ncbi:hypothetical protein FHX77_000684 [Bifidobacterium commune]|uniref:DUF4391 domain-containing protein n=1 Tax=Bifidobacterium commune TaxID=1505727 RepID=A0A1C4GZE5_9BIFI|nr:DUF4391 domain-containing protein [Bifidobacterium commune]MBB2955281.1 hypothetical protein [Bifidobacterium commune]SCC78016.1 protein of unknown function [Bifidobacterium commune]
MTVAHCETVSATSLGLPDSCAIPEAKSVLPKQMFYLKPPVSSRLKQHFVTDIDSITMLALLRPGTLNAAAGTKVKEVLVMGLRQTGADAPVEVMEHIAKLRSSSNILFVCVRDATLADSEDDADSDTLGNQSSKWQACSAFQRKLPVRPGHQDEAQMQTYKSDWYDAASMRLSLNGQTMDDMWQSLCAQVIFGDADGNNLEERLTRQETMIELTNQIAKLEGDHSRAKDGTKRNEIFVKLHKAKKQLDELKSQR